MQVPRITGKLLTQNWVLNLLGQGIPLLFGLITIPWLLRYLGVERFGVLSLSWAMLGYIGQFDLGLSRATTKFVAHCLGSGEIEKLPSVIWTSLLSQVSFGALAAVLTCSLIPALTGRFLKISPAQLPETRTVLLALFCSFPLIIATNSLRGVLEAGQHFTVVNYVKFPINMSVFLLPALSIPLRIGLPGIVLLLIAARVVAGAAYLWACFRFFPILRREFRIDRKLVNSLFVYGGWVTVSNLVNPFLTYIDRFFIGAIVSMSAVGYYTAAYEIATKVWLFPAALLATVFPAFGSLHAAESQERLQQLYTRSVKSILLVSGPLLLILAAFARKILANWLGPDFAARGTATLQILAFGVLLNCIAFVPFGLLQGLGRPDLTAKFHLIELPFYSITLWFFLAKMGLTGAACAWTLRVVVDTVLLFVAVLKLHLVPARALSERALQRAVLALVLPAALVPLSWLDAPLLVELTASVSLLAIFVTAVWAFVLDTPERNILADTFRFMRVARAK